MTDNEEIRLRLLYVEPNENDCKVLEQVVAEEQDIAVTIVPSVENALKQVDNNQFDCIVTAASPLGKNGEGLLSVAGSEGTPFVCFSSAENSIPDTFRNQVDAVVSKGEESNARFLIEKCRSVTGIGRPEDVETPWQRDQPKVPLYGDDVFVAVIKDNDLLWRNQPLQKLLKGDEHTDMWDISSNGESSVGQRGDDGDGRINEADALHNIFARRTTNSEEFQTEIRDAYDSGESLKGFLLNCENKRYFLCWSAKFSDFRIELYRDVTDAVDLSDRHRRVKTLVERAGDGIFILNSNAERVYANDAYMEMLGYENHRNEVLGTPARQNLLDEDLAKGQEAIQNLIENPEKESVRTELRLETRSGEVMPTSISYTLTPFDEDGSYTGLVGVARDITDQKERERTLKKYKELVETATDPMYVLDSENQITFANQAMLSVFNRPKKKIIGSQVETGLPSAWASKQLTAIKRLASEENDEAVEFEVPLEQENTQRYFEIKTTLIDGDNPERGSICICREVTERKERQQKLQERKQRLQKQNEHLERFDSILAHDVRNPLGVARLHLDIAREGNNESVQQVKESITRIDEMIDELLTFARMGGEIEEQSEVNLREIAQNAWAHVTAPESTLTFSDSPGWTTYGDAQKLMQVFENLFRNAIDHNDAAVTITVGVEHADNPILYVSDDGDGIPEDDRENVFQDGFSTGEESSGLGLTIVTAVLNAHDWTIDVTESESGGARFEITNFALQ